MNVRANLLRACRRILPAVLLAAPATQPAWAQSSADQQQEVEMAFDHYTAARTDDQRAAILDYLQHLDHTMATTALIDHIIASRNGVEATAYDKLVQAFDPEGSAAIMDRLAKTDDPVAKGKLVVALRHCEGDPVVHALAACLDDVRPVLFEAHGAHPRRVCDLAYDELFLKLRDDPHYGLDPTPRMTGVITEKTPVKSRDVLIAKLKANLAAPASPSPAPSATPTQSGTTAAKP